MSNETVLVEINGTLIQAVPSSQILTSIIDKINGHSRQVA